MNSPDPIQPLEGDSFSFACHPGVSCFTECCRDLNLVLTPYDLLRMKKRLELSSSDLLDQYTTIRLQEHNGFPGVLLKMNPDERHTCPFVTPSGCRIYEDRPGACRIYPIGRGSSRSPGQTETREFHFVVREAHCRGFNEPQNWTLGDWAQNQGLSPYTLYNDGWMEVITHKPNPGSQAGLAQKMQMFFMASYNLDQFRQFVFKSTFLNRFDLPVERIRRLKEEDEELLLLAFEWLKFFLFGEKVLTPRQD